ncbi:Fic family protein [Undibacterium sp. RTI2.1]|uniref:Fic family protein n=1 Tax=unclassified Undibacterium TaxID=2630295 RepID=UPI002B226D8E|nr:MULTISPECIES: Fic family protein [unclassified Undibacterium]MEB0032178.1 Fic family protein [Undibacterium sp. RTI2.1]MEB0118252.1 Fic family protein [Undibacterium sp. RTI2.2]
MKIKHKTDISMPEVLFTGSGDAAADRRILRMADDGQLRRLYQGVYTSNLASPLEAVVTRNWLNVVGHLLPNGVISYRSAYDAKPFAGYLYVTRGQRPRTIELPGLTIRVLPGTGAVAGDVAYKNMFLASQARWLLENMATGRGVSERVLSTEAIEAELDKMLLIRGEYRFNELRDNCRALAAVLGRDKEFKRLEGIIGALMGTHESKKLQSRQGLARAAGRPYDPARLELFDTLFARLRVEAMPELPAIAETGIARENFAFFEAYFSNYIEGTTFLVSEAEEIVFEGKLIPNRTEDSHDVLGTFQATMQTPWRDRPPSTADDFLHWLKNVNALVMRSRLDKNPGEWKDQNNQAGSTMFVDHTLVQGTLREGFARIDALEDPLARALMTMFVISEVHPFKDGNGRTARLAMNCVLSAAGRSRIIVPTVYREDYLLPLKALSNNSDTTPYLRAMTRIQSWTAAFDYSLDRNQVYEALLRCNSFEEDLKNYRLIFPESNTALPPNG